MDPRRPLQVLPLACFLPLDNAPAPRASPFKSATKRSRSPSALLSPAKRRILRQEGYLASPSSESRKGTGRGRASGRDAGPRGRFEAGSFSMPGNESSRGSIDSPFIDVVAHKTRPVATTTKGTTSSRVGPASPRQYPRCSSVNTDAPTTSHRVVSPLMVPRELPPLPDPQSYHYPGFDVYYDTHIEIPSISSRYNPELESDLDGEETKENLPPRKRTKKTVSMPAEVGSTILFSEITDDKPKAASYPATPCHNSPLHPPVTPHAHRTPYSSTKIVHEFSPGRTPDIAADKLAGKRALEQEVDDVCSDEEL